jgi:peroxiredoxin
MIVDERTIFTKKLFPKEDIKMKKTVLLLVLILHAIAFAQTKAAPDFVLPDIDGANYKLSEHFGEGPILINFWATWCIPCRSEAKKLKKILSDYEDKGLTILAISIDDTKTVGKVKSFVNTHKYPFKILLDTNNEVFKLYQGTNPPLTYLIDNDGNITYSHTGYRKGDEKKLEEEILKLIEKD